jgi:molybdopterin-guanine dinucleotide biosynthesis protein A
MQSRISAVIIAGGSAKRFGGINKSKIIIDGKPIIDRITGIVSEHFSEVIIVTNNPGEFNNCRSCRITEDIITGAGPIGGIHAGMRSSNGDAVFVFAGDMPFLDSGIISDMIKEFEPCRHTVLIPKLGGNIEPLHAVYDNSLTDKLEAFISGEKSRAIRDFLKTIDISYFSIEDTDRNRLAFTNINSPADLKNFDYSSDMII